MNNWKRPVDRIKNELIAYLIKHYELKGNKARLIEETQDTLKRIMPPAPHNTLVHNMKLN